MTVEIALATQTAPSAWWEEEDATLATVLDILNRQAEERAATMGGRGRTRRRRR